ncbi:receptor-type tyrosine-protein phosphatase beta-like, partial [Danio aesculapii]|uniref:receptor-type tyrosine-protein phosphatase beta-like n=1 Tax=Danio aesculapii TaxID=1142201 RepID=UPI0024C05BB1
MDTLLMKTRMRINTLMLMIIVTLEICSAAGGFLIAHTSKGVCLSSHKGAVVLRRCDEHSPAQQWMWTSSLKLSHTLSSSCLWVNQSSIVPRHARLLRLSHCAAAPAWSCYGPRGTLGLAETPMFLHKQGARVVVHPQQKHSNWSMITLDSGGRRRSMPLCPIIGPSTVSAVKSTGEMTTLTVPLWTQSRAVTHHSNTVRSRTKRTVTTALGDPTTFTSRTEIKRNHTLETEAPYDTGGITEPSSTARMLTRTLHQTLNITQSRDQTVESTSDVGQTVESTSDGRRTVESTSDGRQTVESTSDGRQTVESTSDGRQTVESTSDGGQTVESISDGGQTVESTSDGGQTVESTSDGGQTVESISDGGQTIESTSDGGQTVESTSDGGQTVESTSDGGQTVESISDGGQTVESTSDGGQTVESTSDGGQTVESISDGGRTVESTSDVGQTVESTSDVIDRTVELTSNVIDRTVESTSDVIDRTVESTSDVIDRTVESTSDVVDRTVKPTSDVDQTVKSTLDVMNQTVNPLISQTGSSASAFSQSDSETHSTSDSQTGPSEGASITSASDPTLTESSTSSSPVSHTDGSWPNASTRSSSTDKSIRDMQTILPFRTRTTRAITEALSSTESRSSSNTVSSSAKTRGSTASSAAVPYTWTPATETHRFTSIMDLTTTVSPSTAQETTATTALSTRTSATPTAAPTAAPTTTTTATPTTASTTMLLTTEAAVCLVNMTAVSVDMKSCGFNFTTPGRSCSFIMSDGTRFSRCFEDSSRFTCLMVDLNPGTRYVFGIISESDGAQLNISVQTAPAPVSSLVLRSDGRSDSLIAAWVPAVGRVDSYLLSLRPAGTALILPANTSQCILTGLTPGQQYELSVKTRSGARAAEQTTTARTAPGQAARLKLEAIHPNTLRLSWSPPDGTWDFYRILLFNGSSVLENRTVDRLQLQFSFTNWTLIPGRRYRAAVSVQSGDLSTTTACHGGAAPRAVQMLSIRHAAESSLRATWSPPVGEWENYTLLLTDGDATVDSRTADHDVREYSFTNLMPGHAYTITVTTNSGDLSSSAHITAKTIPAQVTQLRVSNEGRTDALQVSWDAALGQLDLYRVLLIQDSVVVRNESVRPNTTALLFQSLRPGALYRAVVTTAHRSARSRQMVAEGRTVPAAVRDVTVSNNGRMDFLSVSWRAAEGDVDSYWVSLRDQERTVHTLTVSKLSTECVFKSLVSGRLYNISITSRSGEFENHTAVQERTQPSTVLNPTATHMAQEQLLKVYWRHADGDFDYYHVSIKHNNIFHQNRTVPKSQNECVFSGLVPGRLYTVTVSTWSGKYESSVSTHGRTLPAGVQNLSLADSGTEDLLVTWASAPGDVDHYEVQLLFNDMKVFPPITLTSSTTQFLLSSLTPGRLYKILVSTFSGPNLRVQFLRGRTVPSTVKNIHISNEGQSNSLRVSWTPGQGDVDRYTVSLSPAQERSVPKHVNEVSFQRLQPGQQYNITVTSVSGSLINNSTATGRTVPSAVSALQLEEQCSTSTLSVFWLAGRGVFDSFRLQLLDERGTLVSNISTPAQAAQHTFTQLTPGKQYRVLIQALSGGVSSNDVGADGRTCPARVSNLSVISNTTTSLSFRWGPPDGECDGFDVLLYDEDERLLDQKSGIMQDCSFLNLRPGVLYKVLVFTRSGDQTNNTSIWARTVPAAVTFLHADSRRSSESLWLSWKQPVGGVSSYTLLILNPDGTRTAEQSLGPDSRSYQFQNLVSGRLYQAVVLTHSGDLTNMATTSGRTDPKPPVSFSFGEITNTSLEITWSTPENTDYDDFDLQWSPRDHLSVFNPYHSPISANRILKGMHPGRQYNISLRTVSGAGTNNPTYSLPISRTIRTKPERVQSLHCRPQNSSTISCSWIPPEADFDSYTIECTRKDSLRMVYSQRTVKGNTVYLIRDLEPHKHYIVSVKVISDSMTSEAVMENVVTMIDRPPLPMARIDENAVMITKSTILFHFNCSWFSDINGAVKFFTIVIIESD